ncbi:C-type mannose receptor 2-like isoform X1 [Echeneis naucrates]|nr:C-type mannose receptor 2-like isoform X1 [Echeneis naucrates]
MLFTSQETTRLLIPVRMNETLFVVLLLLTGFCLPSSSVTYIHFIIKSNKTWFDALEYCMTRKIELVQIQNEGTTKTLMGMTKYGFSGKAWIGLFTNSSMWTWVDGEEATYFNWNPDQLEELTDTGQCVSMNTDGFWNRNDCAQLRPSVCFDGDNYTLTLTEMTWNDAKSNCENLISTLAMIADDSTNDAVKLLIENGTEVWIGLMEINHWAWLGAEGIENTEILNWEPGRPDNGNGKQNCAAIVIENGTWTDEQCDMKYPFICLGIKQEPEKTWIRAVMLTIQSSANVEDPHVTAELQKKLEIAFENPKWKVKLTWKKLRAK